MATKAEQAEQLNACKDENARLLNAVNGLRGAITRNLEWGAVHFGDPETQDFGTMDPYADIRSELARVDETLGEA